MAKYTRPEAEVVAIETNDIILVSEITMPDDDFVRG